MCHRYTDPVNQSPIDTDNELSDPVTPDDRTIHHLLTMKRWIQSITYRRLDESSNDETRPVEDDEAVEWGVPEDSDGRENNHDFSTMNNHDVAVSTFVWSEK